LGLDFGTSNTVAVLRWPDGRIRPLLFDGSPLLPSAVYADGAELLTGTDAEHSARVRPECFEPNPKRRIDDGTVLLGVREVAVPELIAAVLETLRAAATLAGPPPVTLVPEPVAAAAYFAHAVETGVPDGRCIVVYDAGAGTFDASVVGTLFNDATVNGKMLALNQTPLATAEAGWVALAREIQEKYAPVVPIYYRRYIYVRGSHVGGVGVSTMFGLPNLATAYVTT
jgi:molecular chaperone DnaK (HSP70)